MLNKGSDDEKVEPKENDKWMENNDTDPNRDGNPPQQSRLENLGERAKHFASNKYNVVIALLCVLLFIFFIIVIALAIQLGSYKCPEPYECLTFECLSAASQITAHTDLTVDPCDDFWEYSCGGWMRRNPLPENRGSYSVKDKLQENIFGSIRHLIDLVPDNADSVSAHGKAKLFFATCMDKASKEYWVPDKLKQSIHELGGWRIVADPPSRQWKRTDVLKKLHVTYGIAAYFRIVVEADDINPKRNIIKLLPDGLGLPSKRYYFEQPKDEYVKAYKDYIKNVIHEMGGTLHDAIKFSDDMFYYERRLAEVTPDFGELRNVSANYKVMTVEELSRLSTSILWTELLQLYFPGIVQPNTKVAVLSEKYFSDISRLISATDDSLLNDYYMWRLVHAFTPHLSQGYNLAANHLRQKFEGVGDLTLPHEEKWEFCTKLTIKHLGHALGSMYINAYFPKGESEKVVHYVQRNIGALSAQLKSFSWLDDESFTIAEEKVRSLEPLIGYPSFLTNRTAVDEYYKELRVQTDYFRNIKDSVHFLHRMQAQMLKDHNLKDYSWTISSVDVEADYKYAGNRLVVPAGMLGLPLFDFLAPEAVKYGVLGGHVANQLSRIFDDRGINYEQYGALKQWLTNRSTEVYQEKLDCLKHRIANYSQNGVTVDPDLTVGSFMADIGGVKLAFEAYKNKVGDDDLKMLPGVTVNNNQLFFVSYAQSLCEAMRPEKLTALRPATTSLPAQMRVLGTLQQLPEFTSAFSCPEGSVMNPYRQCRAW